MIIKNNIIEKKNKIKSSLKNTLLILDLNFLIILINNLWKKTILKSSILLY